ncbi:MAG TPA: bifunctional UDP-N-acetylglucosamine diphosphorylase/glucosamine-1-phosphate N-acetyltransferase GlmU [Microvirga sp.]|jgi:bifunctional UDP-N-acetylglucosamine pyrophosphorylase/glucosamine-1-phosphate N-acetyltransferase
MASNSFTSSSRTCLAVVLAAGEGTRMKSAKPKVLHEVAGRSMVGHVLAAVAEAGAGRVAVVVGPGRDDVAREAQRVIPHASIFTQRDRLGTAHAVLSARDALANPVDDVVVAFGDTPLMRAETFGRLRAPLADGAAVAVLGFEAADPTGYGRLLQQGGRLVAIREHRDASEAERAVTLCNAGLMALRGDVALTILERIRNDNAKGEYYLTDAVEVAIAMGYGTAVVTAPEEEVQGVNDRAQLAVVERDLQNRLRSAAMAEGVTLIAPETVYFSHDTRIGRDTVVEPHVVFGPGVQVGEDAVVHAFSHLEGALVASKASVGPFARLRPGANLGPGAKVGNFVEIKNAELGAGAKVSHLTYLGDATVGAEANIGAGTITCNYDGFAKYRTVIGEGAFVGSNSALVAPVTIGAGAFVGSGSVVTDDVPEDALAVARGRQTVKEGWAKDFRERSLAAKNKR